MGVLQTWYLAYRWVSNSFFHEFSYVKGLDPPFLSFFSMSFVLPLTICLVSWIPRIPVLCTPDYQYDEHFLQLSNPYWPDLAWYCLKVLSWKLSKFTVWHCSVSCYFFYMQDDWGPFCIENLKCSTVCPRETFTKK